MFIKPNDFIKIPFFSEEECNYCIEYVKWKEEQLSNSVYDVPNMHIVNTTQVNTIQYNSYNFFRDNPQFIDRLSNILQSNLPCLVRPLIVQAWTNIYRKGEGIFWHTHAGTSGHSFTANIFLGGNTLPGLKIMDPGEKNNIWYLENCVGEMILLNSDTHHSVDANETDETRYSIGMTIHSYHAITPDILSLAAVNKSASAIIIA